MLVISVGYDLCTSRKGMLTILIVKSEPDFELEFIANEVAAAVPPSFDHVDVGPPPSYHHDEPVRDEVDGSEVDDSDLVKNKWERRLGDVVEGGYTVQEPDGTVHHIRYTENKKRGQAEEE